jgi:L-lactate utilization protein LutB
MKIELDYQQIDEVVIQSLQNTLANFKENLEAHRNGRGLELFVADPAEDAKIIKKHIKACKRLLEYYGGVVE